MAGLVGLGMAVFGCGDGQGFEQGPEDVDATRQPIEGGTLVGGNNGVLPYSATVRIGSPPQGLQSAGFLTCSAIKIGATRYLTAAHCVDAWTGNPVGQAFISNSLTPPISNPPNDDLYRVTQVYVHATWIAAGNSGAAIASKDFIGRPYDIAIFDVDRTNAIPALATAAGVPKVNANFITTDWISRMVGYGATGDPKAWFDHRANTSPPENFDHSDGIDREALSYTHFYWSWFTDEPRGEGGDSGAPVVNELSGGWWISGVVSGPLGFSARLGRAESVINWIKNPTAVSVAAGSAGYIVNAKSALCLGPRGSGITQFPCFDNNQNWTLESTATPDRFRLRNPLGKCLAIPDNNNTSGTAAQFLPCTTSNYQKWQLTRRGALDIAGGDTAPSYGYYQIKIQGNGSSNLCLEPNAGTLVIAEPIKQVTCATIANPVGHQQAWAFTRR